MVKAVFLDRDGVLNPLVKHGDQYTAPWSYEEFELFPNVKQFITNLKNENFLIFVVTNQPDVFDAKLLIQDLWEINLQLYGLGIDKVLCAMNRNNSYYKPNDGMFQLLINEYGLDCSNSFMIGDRWKDIVPAHNSGLRTIFMGTDYQSPEEYKNIKPDYYASSLEDAYEIIIGDMND